MADLPQAFEIEVKTRHGVLMRADVYLPPGQQGPFPALFAGSAYQKSQQAVLPVVWTFAGRETGPIDFYLDQGYAYVLADVPGTGRSEGAWDPMAKSEGEALCDVIEYVAQQPWCTGKIGTIGQSYFCWTCWNIARTCPPHLTTVVAFDGATDHYRDWMYHGGLPSGFVAGWGFGVALNHQDNGLDIFGGDRYRFPVNTYSHQFDDEWHRRRSSYWELDRVTVPVLSVGLWGKANLHLRGNITGWEQVRGPKKLLLHECDSYPAAQALMASPEFHEREMLPWYEHHLKGAQNGVMDLPPVRYFVEREGRYRQAISWPPEDITTRTFYLSNEKSGVMKSLNDGSLSAEAPSGENQSFSWSYPDPGWIAGTTTFDDHGIPDHYARICTFTSAPFEQEQEFSGSGVLHLFASTDQRDIDAIAHVSVMYQTPDGRWRDRRVTQGWLRASHRHEDPERTQPLRPFYTHDRIDAVEPGQVYELKIELLPMSFLVRPGERLRVEISNNDSRMTEGLMWHFYGYKVGTDAYHADRNYPSRMILPVRPR